MDTSITEEEESGIKDIFDEINVDNSESIDALELAKGARLLGLNPTLTDLKNAMASVDIDNDGVLSYEEFRKLYLVMRKPKEQEREDIKQALETMCAGQQDPEALVLDKAAFVRFLQEKGEDPLSSEEIDELFNDCDQDGDPETINGKELMELLTRIY